MRLHSIELRNYRGVDHRIVEFAVDGVTIVEGPNEIGKSSLAEAIDRLLEDMDSTGRKRVAAIKPVGRDVGPEVAIELETGPYRFRYRKRFLRNPTTELDILQPKPEHHTGREAHERVLSILAETVDDALWKALRIQQGGEVGQADLLAQTSLSAALDRAAGESPAGEGEMSLFSLVHNEYLQYWTETGRRKGDAVEMDRGIAVAEATIAAHDIALEQIEHDVETSSRLNAELIQLHERLEAHRAVVAEHEVRVDALSAIETGIAALQVLYDSAQIAAAEARRIDAVRTGELTGIVAALETKQRCQDAVLAAAPPLDTAKARRVQSESDLEAVREVRDTVVAKASERRATLAEAGDRRALEQMEIRLQRVTAATEAIAAAAVAASMPVDLALLESIRSAQRQADIAQARVDAARPIVKVDAATQVDLDVDGERVELAAGGSLERPVDGTIVISARGLLTITVVPGGGPTDATAELESSQGRLRELLKKAGAADITEVERLYRARADAEQSIDEQRRILATSLETMTIENLEARLALLRARVAARGVAIDASDGPDEEGARSAAEGADKEVEASERDVREAEMEASSARTRYEKELVFHRELDAELQMAAKELERRETALELGRSDIADALVKERLLAAEDGERDALARLDHAQAGVAREGLAQARDSLDNARNAFGRAEQELRTVEDELIAVRTRLRDHGEDGLAEDRDAAVADLERLVTSRTRYQVRAAARRLLYDTLRSERDVARRAYVTPLREHIQRLGAFVFGGDFAVELNDEDLRVVSRTLHGRTVPFESLSVGAQEQIALISRLACATIVAPDGGVPVILDDALGNSDPQRLQSMGAVLAVAGRQCQIIVLTCQPDRYDHVGSASIVRLS